MNKRMKKTIAIATLLIFGAGVTQAPLQATTLQTATPIYKVWDGAGKAYQIGSDVYAPVRDICDTMGCGIEWVSEGAQNKLVLTGNNGISHQVLLDPVHQMAITETQSFYYDMREGRIALPVAFYENVMTNASCSFDPASQTLSVGLNDADQGICYQNLPVYEAPEVVAEVTPVPAAPVPVPAEPEPTLTYFESGQASWYGAALHGNLTASGEPFNMYDLTAAHKTLAFGTKVKVTNQNNGLSVVVRITDRGPFAHGRVIDLSDAAARQINMISTGVAPVTLEIIG